MKIRGSDVDVDGLLHVAGISGDHRASLEKEIPPSKRGRREDKHVRRIPIKISRPRGEVHPKLAKVDHQGSHQTDKEYNYGSICQSHQGVPEVVPRLLINVAV